jgi:nucleoid-associated protein YejK
VLGELSNNNKEEKTDKIKLHEKVCAELHEIYVKKNEAYGDSFGKTFEELGIISAVTRMTDKLQRIISLTQGAENKIQDESLKDTLKDLANYAVMTYMELE